MTSSAIADAVLAKLVAAGYTAERAYLSVVERENIAAKKYYVALGGIRYDTKTRGTVQGLQDVSVTIIEPATYDGSTISKATIDAHINSIDTTVGELVKITGTSLQDVQV